eukprot:CAMPEP_0116871706 /NCGR_PEP_ID=MMETSP0463-20121206/2184_1 /TAXON_ID=181622 /ORGANISM="Strombidinopsis sp, Strain SopsisLIS2011" /LENGTH=79 /DNA_ID=CAMNT_0004510651 /DNA_START=318 /DNA_END=557 /DNA_ORIENTATION=+
MIRANRNLRYSLLMILVLVYVSAYINFAKIDDDLRSSDLNCSNTLWECFYDHLNWGLRSNGAISDFYMHLEHTDSVDDW